MALFHPLVLVCFLGFPGTLSAGGPSTTTASVSPAVTTSNPAMSALKLVSLDATCGTESIHVTVKFERPFNGIIYSKGAFYTPDCVYVLPGTGAVDYTWDVPISQCETTETKAAPDSKSGERTFENTVVFQNDAHFQDIFDVVRRIRCSTAAQYEKIVDFSPINVNMKDVVTASFTGDDVKVSIDVQNGRGPFAPSLNQGFIQIGDTVTLIVYMTAQSGNWDLQIRECVALDSKERASLTIQDENGCVTKPKIMSPFALTHDRKNPAILIAYSYMKAFRFPDDMQVQIKCVVAVCRDRCQKSDRCSGSNGTRTATDISSSTTESSEATDSDLYEDSQTASSTTSIRSNTTSSTRVQRKAGAGDRQREARGRQRGTFEMPLMSGYLNRQRMKRQVPGGSEGAAGTLPLRHMFNVISPEDIASLRNSSVIMIDAPNGGVPVNSLCVNQVMFIFLLAFLFVLVISTSVGLTLMCLRNKALLRERKATQEVYGCGGGGSIGGSFVEARMMPRGY
ncbi:hypothetical protein BV898_13691 [Hypsibius exemplaris]|uniref:ZP domain-containing protein n=1 Tax=Hypsibius exemplaris TaxID=2072580 RepID=A0A1W0WA11_HYPEX|nr:hypothetical protein BV898_13691 [Hypsibius exemplaris]